MSHQMFVVSSLEKVFQDERPTPFSGRLSMLRKDQLNYQLAFFVESPADYPHYFHVKAHVTVESPLKKWMEVNFVKSVPSAYPAGDVSDGNYLRTEPGMFPDLLEPLDDGCFRLMTKRWGALWIQLLSDEDTPAGIFPVTVTVTAGEGERAVTLSKTVQVEVVPASLPRQELIHTEWFHGDCLADYYHVDVFSEAHWRIMKEQLASAAKYGINMILTPVLTPALDTAVGGERTTIQLTDVKVSGGKYSFGFEKLERFVRMCQSLGIEYFEISHLYTQWGAQHCPKVIANVDGVETRIFGWESDAVGEEYKAFLNAFLPALNAELTRLGLEKDHVFFHVSDEPSKEHLPQYHACKAQLEGLLKGYPLMDALSAYEFYEQGVCANPVVATDHVTPFLENNVPNLWVYYCVGQGHEVSNRFMAMPSARNRIIGLQFYKFQIAGFLQWGFNFYNSMHSLRHIDPYAVTDADGAFPSGDPFLVYPGPDGTPWESIRQRVFYEAVNDLKALKLLESLTSREHVMELMEGGLSEGITFSRYPKDAGYLLALRERVNREIKERVG